MPASTLSGQTVKELPQPGISGSNQDFDDNELIRFPEGGTAAWCTVIGGALVQFCGYGYIMSFGVYLEFYTAQYLTDETASSISWIGSVDAFLGCAFSLVSGPLYDRGYFYHLLIGGSLLQSLSLFMLSLAQPGQYYQIFLAQGIGLGMAQGILFVPTMAVVSHYFHRRRTLALSLVVSGSSLGSIIHPIMLNNLFNRGVGFANGVRISAAFVSVLLLIACLLMRTRLEPPTNPANYLSVGKGIVHDLPFSIMSTGLLCFNIALMYPLFYFQLDAVHHNTSETFSFYSLVLINGGSLIGRLSTASVAHHVSVPRLIVIAAAACGICIFAMIDLDGASIAILGTTFGYFSGIYIALMSPLMSLLTSDFSELGARMGCGMTVAGTGTLIGGPLAGALLTSRYKWWRPSLFAGLMALTASALLMTMWQLVLIRQKRSSEGRDTEESANGGLKT